MIILQDTYAKFNLMVNAEIRKTKLYVGSFTLPTDQSICIEINKDMQSLVSMVSGRRNKAFVNQLVRSKEVGSCLTVITVDRNIASLSDLKEWRKDKKYDHEMTGETLEKSLIMLQKIYGCRFLFCQKSEVADKVIEILERREDLGA